RSSILLMPGSCSRTCEIRRKLWKKCGGPFDQEPLWSCRIVISAGVSASRMRGVLTLRAAIHTDGTAEGCGSKHWAAAARTSRKSRIREDSDKCRSERGY